MGGSWDQSGECGHIGVVEIGELDKWVGDLVGGEELGEWVDE